MSELPAITSSSYGAEITTYPLWECRELKPDPDEAMQRLIQRAQLACAPQSVTTEATPASMTRIVRVYIADTDENIPIAKRLLYTSEEKLTESTDQELFFEVPIQSLLEAHNKLRVTTPNKKQSEKFGKEIMLEPARIRDLKMAVITVASF